MKTFFILAVVTAGAILSGCTTDHKNLALDRVGPSMVQSRPAGSTNGILLVYSAYGVNASFSARDPYRPRYSDYTILSADGGLLQQVHNNSGAILQDAVPVELPPGQYNVRARANGYGFVTVPVTIGARQTTVLHLEGGSSWPDESVFNQTNAVRLPNGQIIGWRG
jgi:hypothetical protein